MLLAVRRHGPRRVIVEAKPVDDDAVAARTASAMGAMLAAAGRFVDVTVSSFDPALLLRIRRAVRTDAVRTALLGETGTPAHALLRRALEDGHDEIHPSLPDLCAAPHAVGAARALGVGVTSWTVNAAPDLRRMADLGVEAVVTDDVAGACATLREHAAVTAAAAGPFGRVLNGGPAQAVSWAHGTGPPMTGPGQGAGPAEGARRAGPAVGARAHLDLPGR